MPAEQQPPTSVPSLCCRELRNCSLSGSFPAAWAAPVALPALKTLEHSSNRITGSLPLGLLSGLLQITTLDLTGNLLAGPLPTKWASTTLRIL
jgi:hypothetical protein